jgi:hypothetical protein
MIVTFSYPLPDELFVDGVSGAVEGTYMYNGPETFEVHIDRFGNVLDIDVDNGPVKIGPYFKKPINASENPEFAYMMQHYFVENYVYEREFVDEILENGDVYKKILNPDLPDAYEIKYDFETDAWKLNQIVKDQSNPSILEAKRRKEYVKSFSSKYAFGTEIDAIIEQYLNELDEFVENNPPIKTWKYINFDFAPVPKIPYILPIEFAKIPNEGV